MKQLILLVAIYLLTFSCSSDQTGDRLIVPFERVGLITKTSTMDQLINVYGKKNTKKKKINIGEGEEQEGLVIFPDTNNELEVVWSEGNSVGPAFVRIGQENTDWQTEKGLSVGTSLLTLEDINGRPFNFYGFEWDFAGLITNWNGGNLHQTTIALMPQNFEALNDGLMGDILLSSNDPLVRPLDLVVGSIVITFP